MEEPMARRSFFFGDKLYEDLRKHSEQKDIPMSEVVREAVKKEIYKNDD